MAANDTAAEFDFGVAYTGDGWSAGIAWRVLRRVWTGWLSVAHRGGMMSTMTIWDMLEQDAPKGCEAVQDLYSWTLNYEAGKGPFTLFLDLIGWSEDNIGEPMFDLRHTSTGYVELDKLGLALREYADRPQDVREYVDKLLAAESEG